MITDAGFWKGRDTAFPMEFTPQIKANGERTIATVNALLLACFDDTRIMFDQCNSGWRPLAVNEKTANSGKASNHIQALADDQSDGDDVEKLEDAPRILARWTLGNRVILERLGLWCEDPRWTARFDEKTKKWKFWVHYQTIPPASGRRFYIPSATPPVTPPLSKWVKGEAIWVREQTQG